jgi:hypothetical protein
MFINDDFRNLIPQITVPVYFWWHDNGELKFNHGMSTAIHFNDGNGLLLTCAHVLEGYEEQKEKVENCIFQIGTLIFKEPRNILISENNKLDLLSLKIKDGYLKLISKGWHPEKSFYAPPHWPNRNVEKGEQVFIVGCTGDGRKFDPEKGLSFASSSFVLNVSEVLDDQFTIISENLVSVDGIMKWSDVVKLGGISGSGVFTIRNEVLELVGVIKAGEKYDDKTIVLFATHSKFLKNDGTISR